MVIWSLEMKRNHLVPDPAPGHRSRHLVDAHAWGGSDSSSSVCALLLAGTSKCLMGIPGSHPKHFTDISGTQNASQVSSFVIFKVEDFFPLRSDEVRTANFPAASQLIFPVPISPKKCAPKVPWLWVCNPAPHPCSSVVLLGDLVQAIWSCCVSDTYVPQG